MSAAATPHGRFVRFLRAHVFDFLLVLFLSTTLVYVVSYAFYSAGDIRSNPPLCAVLMMPLLVCLYSCGWSKRALVPGSIASAVVSLAMIAIAYALTPSDVPLFVADEIATSSGSINDDSANYVIFAFVEVIVPVLVFLLSRRRIGLVFLLVASVLSCGVIQFLYRDFMTEQGGLIAATLALAFVAALFVHQSYKSSIMSASRVRGANFAKAFGFSLAIGALSACIGLAVFYGAIAGMGLMTPEVKLFEHHVSVPIDEEEGVYSDWQVQGDQTTSQTTDEQLDTSDNTPTGYSAADFVGQLAANPLGRSLMQAMGLDPDNLSEDYEAIAYQIIRFIVIVAIILALLAIAAIVLIWRARREFRLRRISRYDNNYQARYLYEFLLSRFARLGLGKPENLGPYEYAMGFEEAHRPFVCFVDEKAVDFIAVTQVYVHAVYAGQEIKDEHVSCVTAYYRAFFKNARRITPWPKWIFWRFWRI